MTISEPSLPRATNREVVERRRLQQIARPFTKDIMKWQAQLAFYRHSRDAANSTNRDAVIIGAGLGDLLAEVQAAKARFEAATEGEPMTGAIEDAARALERLIEQVSAELR